MTFLVRVLTTEARITLPIAPTPIEPLPRKDRGGPGAGTRLPWSASLRELQAAPGGLVVYLDLLAPDVLLHDLGVLDHVLADADLFLGHGALLHDDLFLGYRDPDLLLAYLGLCCGSLRHRHTFDGDLLVAGRDLYLLAVGPDALADAYLSGLALTGACGELLLDALHPELVLSAHVRGGRLGLVGLVGAALGTRALEAVVGVDLVLEGGCDLPIVVEGRPVLGRVLLGGHRDSPAHVVGGAHRLPRDEGGAGTEEAHLDTDVLWLVGLVDKEVVDLTDLGTALVVDLVAGEAVLDSREPVAALLVRSAVFRHANLLVVCVSFTTHRQRHCRTGRFRPYPVGRCFKGWRSVLAHN